jgi:hypothetical protein
VVAKEALFVDRRKLHVTVEARCNFLLALTHLLLEAGKTNFNKVAAQERVVAACVE